MLSGIERKSKEKDLKQFYCGRQQKPNRHLTVISMLKDEEKLISCSFQAYLSIILLEYKLLKT
ncbi:hypothetical protein CBW18_14850 [Pedobacter sp. AJM]|nr:hypothetical protein CBW18_14850 [Pedobacter sp. AJM]